MRYALVCLWIPMRLTAVLGMVGHGLGPLFGRDVKFSLVFTEWNWSFSTSTLVSVSLWRIPSPFFRGAIPCECCRLPFRYVLNSLKLLLMGIPCFPLCLGLQFSVGLQVIRVIGLSRFWVWILFLFDESRNFGRRPRVGVLWSRKFRWYHVVKDWCYFYSESCPCVVDWCNWSGCCWLWTSFSLRWLSYQLCTTRKSSSGLFFWLGPLYRGQKEWCHGRYYTEMVVTYTCLQVRDGRWTADLVCFHLKLGSQLLVQVKGHPTCLWICYSYQSHQYGFISLDLRTQLVRF